MVHPAWEIRARAKRGDIYAKIPPSWLLQPSEIPPPETRDVTDLPQRFLSQDERVITESNPTEILANLHTGLWSAEIVTVAFCHRAAIAHQVVNCLSEILFDSALTQARQLDETRRLSGEMIGPLHGLPVSLMDRFRVAGAETAAGYVGWLGKKETLESESQTVKQMRKLGAIPFCKTNIPMSMLLGETTNNIIGSTVNPFVRHLSSGGAAGGEGALLAMKGSPLGWATEIAGSARIPSTFNSLYTLKTSHGRLSSKGLATSLPGLPICDSVVCPITTDLSFLKFVMKTSINTLLYQEDPALIEIPWRESRIRDVYLESRRRPIFAVLRWDGHVRPHPPIQRAMERTVRALESQNYEVIEWTPPPHHPAVQNLFEIIGSDNAQGLRDALKSSGEPPVSQLKSWYSQPNFGPRSTTEFWNLCQQRYAYRLKYQEYWNSTEDKTASRRPIDGVIMPVSPSAAVQENKFTYFCYSAIVNLLDYTAGAFPVTFANQMLDGRDIHYEPVNDEDRAVWETYDPQMFDGAPVGLQVMCRRLEEEKVLGLMDCIKHALNEYCLANNP